MPTLYELTLPQTNYLSSGLNLLDKHSVFAAINAGAIALNADGGIFSLSKNNTHYYQWNAGQLAVGVATPTLKQLEMRYKSLMSVSDFYLKYFNEIQIDH